MRNITYLTNSTFFAENIKNHKIRSQIMTKELNQSVLDHEILIVY